jgi:hypothetical protein
LESDDEVSDDEVNVVLIYDKMVNVWESDDVVNVLVNVYDVLVTLLYDIQPEALYLLSEKLKFF